jgi:hypothetical protein
MEDGIGNLSISDLGMWIAECGIREQSAKGMAHSVLGERGVAYGSGGKVELEGNWKTWRWGGTKRGGRMEGGSGNAECGRRPPACRGLRPGGKAE